MFSRFLLSICLILLCACADAQELLCGDLFARQNALELTRSPEEIEQTIHSLSALRREIDLKHANGDRSAHVKTLERDYAEQIQTLIQYLESNHLMKSDELFAKVRAAIQIIQAHEARLKSENAKDRDKQQSEVTATVIDGSKVIFHQIEPGSFEMGEDGKQINTTITKPFDMAATQTTQIVWRRVVEAAKARFPGEFDALLNANPSHFPGDLNPVEQVSYEDIQVWLTAANKLIDAGDPVVEAIMPGTAKGSHLRLPTEAEWEFVARSRGAAKGLYHFGENEAELPEYAWFSTNAGSKTHPVAEKKPLVIGGKEFYDLHGNVWEWANDWYDATLQGGVDPQGPATGSIRVMRGGSWNNGARGLRTGYRSYWGPSNRSNIVGFRLVRTAVP